MFAFLCAFIALAVILGVTLYAIGSATEGYEDISGFHAVSAPAAGPQGVGAAMDSIRTATPR